MSTAMKLAAGSSFPNIAFKTVGDGTIDINALTGWRLLAVYRGKHCPLCKSYFKTLDGLLEEFKAAGVTVVAVSADPQLRDAVAASALGGLLDHVISVEEAGVFKPHPKVYDLAVERLGLPAASIAFQSSNSWDAYAASAYGMRVVWCNRYGQRPERLPGAPDCEIRSLVELPALLERA